MGSVHPPDVSTWHLSTSILGHLYRERENCSEPLFMFDCSLHDDDDGARGDENGDSPVEWNKEGLQDPEVVAVAKSDCVLICAWRVRGPSANGVTRDHTDNAGHACAWELPRVLAFDGAVQADLGRRRPRELRDWEIPPR